MGRVKIKITTSPKIKNLKDLQLKFIKYKTIGLVICSAATFTIFLCVMYIQSEKINKLAYDTLSIENTKLQYSVSTQLEVIVNQPNFISFLRSGKQSRRMHMNEMRWIFNALNNTIYQGFKIVTVNNETIYNQGESTDFFVSLPLCYLGNRYNIVDGVCEAKLTLYFNYKDYVNLLSSDNYTIENNITNNKVMLKIFSCKFGNFNIDNSSHSTAYFSNRNNSNKIIMILFILMLLFIIIIWSILNMTLNNLLDQFLISPLKKISVQISNKKYLLEQPDTISELNELIVLINKFHDYEINKKLTEIAGKVSHDLKHPILGLTILVESIKSKISDKDYKELKYYLEYLLNTSSDILKFYRDETPVVNELESPNILVNIFINKIVGNLKYDIKIINESIAIIKSDYNKLQRAIINLLNNAVDATKNIVNPEISITVTKINNMVTIKIIDNGIGIPEEQFEQVVKSGKSLKHSGNGVGLSYAIDYMTIMGGSLLVNSKSNYGTQITLEFPEHVVNNVTTIANDLTPDKNFLILTTYKQCVLYQDDFFYFTKKFTFNQSEFLAEYQPGKYFCLVDESQYISIKNLNIKDDITIILESDILLEEYDSIYIPKNLL